MRCFSVSVRLRSVSCVCVSVSARSVSSVSRSRATIEKFHGRIEHAGIRGHHPFVRTERQNGGAEEDLLPGTECDLVISIPPGETIHLVGKIVSIRSAPAILGLSDEEWATYAEEAEDG